MATVQLMLKLVIIVLVVIGLISSERRRLLINLTKQNLTDAGQIRTIVWSKRAVYEPEFYQEDDKNESEDLTKILGVVAFIPITDDKTMIACKKPFGEYSQPFLLPELPPMLPLITENSANLLPLNLTDIQSLKFANEEMDTSFDPFDDYPEHEVESEERLRPRSHIFGFE
ncbi:hypothetical protein ACOME3_000842 [Neoechinorhynchus agilis]